MDDLPGEQPEANDGDTVPDTDASTFQPRKGRYPRWVNEKLEETTNLIKAMIQELSVEIKVPYSLVAEKVGGALTLKLAKPKGLNYFNVFKKKLAKERSEGVSDALKNIDVQPPAMHKFQ